MNGICPWRMQIQNGFAIVSWIDTHKIAAVARWQDGKEMLWIDGHICEMLPDAMPPKEIIYNLKHLSPSKRTEAIDAIKQMVTLAQTVKGKMR